MAKTKYARYSLAYKMKHVTLKKSYISDLNISLTHNVNKFDLVQIVAKKNKIKLPKNEFKNMLNSKAHIKNLK
ncbi:hypothetical protein BpHYR1_003337 [Brachionus plicatilis]|uniref:Uncharacterized protein n=1 Tax=Brachionus plicatilis TaxID=10195 RepID=A0A3M7R9X1_BRAPC|nr:hypothetical protein BpHYR1_003337 [Brachionus plicatilis]